MARPHDHSHAPNRSQVRFESFPRHSIGVIVLLSPGHAQKVFGYVAPVGIRATASHWPMYARSGRSEPPASSRFNTPIAPLVRQPYFSFHPPFSSSRKPISLLHIGICAPAPAGSTDHNSLSSSFVTSTSSLGSCHPLRPFLIPVSRSRNTWIPFSRSRAVSQSRHRFARYLNFLFPSSPRLLPYLFSASFGDDAAFPSFHVVSRASIGWRASQTCGSIRHNSRHCKHIPISFAQY